ncbi:hypothetical protein FA13DRAFT_1092749 [Coprinellus micaceus]|uniref:BTB domain-containing protein n=1 Tax=Coprinellus micaceus TaxID=71717 RepID=A0A4Y7TS45_COPMI|nr:hypothetical protein FA13DRAFT_1092749 [Coprinellus micaceus]
MSTATATASTSKRGRFFYELITVKVEDKLYQIRKDRLERTSQYFQRIFSSLKDGDTNEGSKENPLELRGCTKAEFENSPLVSDIANALAHLESSGLDSKEKATIGMQYGVSQFFIEGSTDLAKGGFEASDIDNLGDSMGYATLSRLLLVRSMARETHVALPLDKLKMRALV